MGAPQGFLVVPIGVDPDGDLRMLELDADDALKVAFGEAAKGLVGLHGWYSSAWQKAPIPFGVSDSLAEFYSDTNLASGSVNITGDTVPAGELWVVTRSGMRYDGTSPTEILSILDGSALSFIYDQQLSPVTNTWYYCTVQLIALPGENLRWRVNGATAGDVGRFTYGGYKIDLDQ